MSRQAHFPAPSVQGQREQIQKGKMADLNTSGHAQFSIAMSQDHSRFPKRISQNGSVTLADPFSISPESFN